MAEFADPPDRWTKSRQLARELENLVPGGAHTYAKGPDQYPEDCAPIMARGRGSHVWDVDGNEYVEFGSGLRSVILGHAHPAVTEAVCAAVAGGTNFVRPAELELLAAEDFLQAVPTMDMVKFAKNGSDVTTAAVRLARAATGRDLVAICRDHPFFSTDDWFIGTTPMDAGIPQAIRDLTVSFPYGDLDALARLFESHPQKIAAVVLEVEAGSLIPPKGYLKGLIDIAHRYGSLVVFDEMITGFRRALAGSHSCYRVEPDLCTFGKAIGNGVAVSALAGRRDVMELGGLKTEKERVFLLSTTHGAESIGLAALRATIRVHRTEGISERLQSIGAAVRSVVSSVIAESGLTDYVKLHGMDCNLVFATLDAEKMPSQPHRTIFMRELIRHGVVGPSFVVSAAIDDRDIELTAEAVRLALRSYAAALEVGDPTAHLGGRSVKPVFRRRA